MNNFTIPETYGCTIQPADELAVRDGGAELVGFHKHCQATVLAAYGTSDPGNGATWATISSLVASLTSLPSGWINYFKNTGNMTEDFAGVLKTINETAEKLRNLSFNLTFKDASDAIVSQGTLNPYNDSSTDYQFKIGRDVTLSINGKTVKFNTAISRSTDVTTIDLATTGVPIKIGSTQVDTVQIVDPHISGISSQNIEIPQKTITFKRSGTSIATILVAAPNSTSQEINLDVDRCLIPGATATVSDAAVTLKPDSQHQVYYYTTSIGGSVTASINLTNYGSAVPPNLIQFEFLARNESSDDDLTLTITAQDTWRLVPLTDLLTVSAGQTNAYAFRADPNAKAITYSLAYKYSNS